MMDDIPVFNPSRWFWRIGDDTSRYWSSEVSAYVTEANPLNTTCVPDEAQLIAVLTNLGLAHP